MFLQDQNGKSILHLKQRKLSVTGPCSSVKGLFVSTTMKGKGEEVGLGRECGSEKKLVSPSGALEWTFPLSAVRWCGLPRHWNQFLAQYVDRDCPKHESTSVRKPRRALKELEVGGCLLIAATDWGARPYWQADVSRASPPLPQRAPCTLHIRASDNLYGTAP